MAEAPTHTTSMMQLFIDWEIQLLILLSFALQVFLFFSGGRRRHNTHMLLRIMTWLSYLSADFIAAYALGHLSRNFPTSSTTTDDENHKAVTHELAILWAPFLLIHLGGQDTMTAFSIEDNELWLRHLLNLVGQGCLVVYVLWKWVALARYQLVIPAAFLFVAGIIKYGERIWALKLGSLRKLVSTRKVVYPARRDGDKMGQTYQEIIRYAHRTEECVRDLFAGRNFDDIEPKEVVEQFVCHPDYTEQEAQGQGLGEEAQLNFKRIEIELCRMHNNLFTKSRVIQSKAGAILRCGSLTSTVVAFVLYVKMTTMSSSGGDGRSRSTSTSDGAITYILFIGAFCLEVCSFFISRTMSPWDWPPVLEESRSLECWLLNRVAWPIFVRIQPETKPLWSNSMGQYSLGYEWRRNKKKWSRSTVFLAKMAEIFGASELWNKISNTNHADVTREIKELINDSIGDALIHGTKRIPVPSFYGPLFNNNPFEKALVSLHFWTNMVLEEEARRRRTDLELGKSSVQEEGEEEEGEMRWRRRKSSVEEKEEGDEEEGEARPRRPYHLMRTCKRLSNYMVYLLIEHPAMLPVGSNIHHLLGTAHNKSWTNPESLRAYFVEKGFTINLDFWRERRQSLLVNNEAGVHAELEILEQVWVRMLIYAAGKSKAEEHARRLSTGGELITFVWLLMFRRCLGDAAFSVGLTEAPPPPPPYEALVTTHLFDPTPHVFP
uniref:Uncharacterized protein n=1 Tax=Avena sativa TaxID=4498 RepID=A0ACD5XZ79_AVESA